MPFFVTRTAVLIEAPDARAAECQLERIQEAITEHGVYAVIADKVLPAPDTLVAQFRGLP